MQSQYDTLKLEESTAEAEQHGEGPPAESGQSEKKSSNENDESQEQ